MWWLESVSNSISLIVCIAVMAVVVASLRRNLAPRLAWQGRVIPLLLLGAAGTWAVSGYVVNEPEHILAILAARLFFLAATWLAWPWISHFAGHAAEVSHRQAQCRRDLAMAEATESRHWLQLAEKIARVGHWRYVIAEESLDWSDEVYTILGLDSHGSAPALNLLLDMIAPDDRAQTQADFNKALHTASPFEFTVKTLARSESPAYITLRGIPECDETGRVIALFGVLADSTAQKRVEEDLKSVCRATMLANEALERLARQDALTRLANRRHFDEVLPQEFNRAAREMRPVGLIMIDLDHFKSFNDQYGHPAGDICLQKVSAAIAAIPQRPADLVARYGGEEIAVLLPNTDLIGTDIMADLIVRAVRDLAIPHAANPDRIVTISCGTAAFEPARDRQPPMGLIEKADGALYAAKLNGRNRAMAA